ncbi:MAG: tetratricopeptide repeat protein [Desulfomonilia bacterium]|jgi:tetratricopeptide (TPR) repeat protein
MKINSKRLCSQILIVTFFIVSIFAIYYQVINFEFNGYDDPQYVINNPMVEKGITLDSMRWAFTSIGYASNWHPLTWLSHMLDVEFFNMNPGMHHLTNVFLHIANSLLLFFIFFRMTGEKWKCAVVAALFAIHPLHVESVAWIAERKDVLSTFFFMLTIWSYTWYVEQHGALKYLLVITLYILGLMAKPMLVTLPFILLLLDFWPIQRIEFDNSETGVFPQNIRSILTDIHWDRVSSLLWEKIPLFVLAGMSCIITFLAQKSGGALGSSDIYPIGSRIANASTAYIGYLLKMFWPINLSVFYTYPGTFSSLLVVGSSLLLVLITLFTFRFTRQFPYLLVGWLWYLGTLVPVIGIVQVGSQSMADRYTYISLIGIFIMLTWGVTSLVKRWQIEKYILIFFFVVIIPVLMWRTWVQVGYWKDSITLFSHALNVQKDNYLAHSNLSGALYNNNDIQGAIYHAQAALDLMPNYIFARYTLGLGLTKQRNFQEAINQFRKILQIDPNFNDTHFRLGYALYELGIVDEAVLEFKKALQLDPRNTQANDYIQIALAKQRGINNVIASINEMLKTDSQNYDLHYRLAEMYRNKGNKKDAIDHYKKALSIRPGSAEVLYALAIQYAESGDYENALSILQKMAQLYPTDPDVYYNIACIYSKQGRKDDATTSLNLAIDKGFKKWNIIKTDPDLENIRGTDYYRKLIISK